MSLSRNLLNVYTSGSGTSLGDKRPTNIRGCVKTISLKPPPNTVEQFKSCCLPYITYACEALSFSKTDILRLDNLMEQAVCRIFNVHGKENVDCL